MIDIIIEYTVVSLFYIILYIEVLYGKMLIVKIQLKYTNHLINVNKSLCYWIELILKILPYVFFSTISTHVLYTFSISINLVLA